MEQIATIALVWLGLAVLSAIMRIGTMATSARMPPELLD
jgi:hypothetical protein